MRKIGFADRWIQLIMACVSTVSYSVLINGDPQGRIVPAQGLRQGDPMSPYLFLLCVEGLSSPLSRVESEKKNLKCPNCTRKTTSESHLLCR